MKNFIIIIFLAVSISSFSQSKETHGDRNIEYTIDLDCLKFKEQKINIENSLKELKGVKKVNLNALEYKLYVSVFQSKEENKTTDIDDIKIILSNNKVEIKKHIKTVK